MQSLHGKTDLHCQKLVLANLRNGDFSRNLCHNKPCFGQAWMIYLKPLCGSGNGFPLCNSIVCNVNRDCPFSRIVIARLFILTSAPLQCSPAYLFTTSSADVLTDVGDSWEDYILTYLNVRFASYALRMNVFLSTSFSL